MHAGGGGYAGVLRYREPLARHTVWGIGGFADRYFEPADIDDLAAFLADLPGGEPLQWIGLGSNLLVRDGGVRGTVISTGRLRAVERIEPTKLQAQAGAACPRVARIAARHGLTGCEFLAGIPGSMGGALAMNAGAFGTETWPAVREVETIDDFVAGLEAVDASQVRSLATDIFVNDRMHCAAVGPDLSEDEIANALGC